MDKCGLDCYYRVGGFCMYNKFDFTYDIYHEMECMKEENLFMLDINEVYADADELQ